MIPRTLVEALVKPPMSTSTESQRGRRSKYIELFQNARMFDRVMKPRLENLERLIHEKALGIDCNVKRYPHGSRPWTKESIYDSLEHCHHKVRMWDKRNSIKSLTKRIRSTVEWTVDEIRCFNQVVSTVAEHIENTVGKPEADQFRDDNLIAMNLFYNHRPKSNNSEFLIPSQRSTLSAKSSLNYRTYQQQIESRKQHRTLLHIY